MGILQDLARGGYDARLFHSASFLGRNRIGNSEILFVIFSGGGRYCSVERSFDGSGALKRHRGGIARQIAHRRRASDARRRMSCSRRGDALAALTAAAAAQLSELGSFFRCVRVRLVGLVGALLPEAFDDALVRRRRC